MSDLPGYDEWKLRTPEDDHPECEFCGAAFNRGSLANRGWQPDECNGNCGLHWRDPDAEYEAKRDDRDG